MAAAPFSSPPGDTPRERLIEATIHEIERQGLSQLTVRAVAAAAGMNIAAVSYHFGSKQALVAAALEGTIEHMVADTDAYLQRLPADPVGVLAELLGYYLEGALRYPRVSKAHLYDAFVAEDYGGPFPTLFAPVLPRLRAALRDSVPELDERGAAQRLVAALSGVYFPACFGGLYRSLGTLETPRERAAYVQELARRTLAPVEKHAAVKARARRR